eukprot:GHVU01054965.1.p1 GENE.GHVU01054965.1~~GHVU01054965.1.p1  ORF type:complete len:555 (+),score=88.35 GHVU01054965.1:332-1996(+)
MERLGLSKPIVEVCHSLRMTTPTEIQTLVIPQVLRGCHVLGRANTGTGKTACYLLPTIQKWSADPFGIFALIIVPSRELAMQVRDVASAIGSHFQLRTCVMVGGEDILKQNKEMATRPHFVVGTPGRLHAFFQGDPHNAKLLRHLQVLVYDEADRLISKSNRVYTLAITEVAMRRRINNGDGGEVAQSEGDSCASNPEGIQFLYFSATAPPHLLARFRERHGDSGVVVNMTPNESGGFGGGSTAHMYIFVPFVAKLMFLVHVLATYIRTRQSEEQQGREEENVGGDSRQLQLNGDGDGEDGEEQDVRLPVNKAASAIKPSAEETAIVFVSSIGDCQLVGTALHLLGFPTGILHSLQKQRQRSAALGKFRSMKSRVLVATDVVARGLDVPSVGLVVNFDLPHSTDDYVHRAGRCGRAGRKGICLNFVTNKGRDVKTVHKVEERLGRQLEQFATEEDEVLKLANRVAKVKVKAQLLLRDTGFEEQLEKREEQKAATVAAASGATDTGGNEKRRKRKATGGEGPEGGGPGRGRRRCTRFEPLTRDSSRRGGPGRIEG